MFIPCIYTWLNINSETRSVVPSLHLKVCPLLSLIIGRRIFPGKEFIVTFSELLLFNCYSFKLKPQKHKLVILERWKTTLTPQFYFERFENHNLSGEDMVTIQWNMNTGVFIFQNFTFVIILKTYFYLTSSHF